MNNVKKKNIEKRAEARLKRINDLEFLLGKRKAEIKDLKEEVEGYKQVIAILEAFIIEGVEKSGEVVIPKKEVSEGLRHGYTLNITNESYILRSNKAETE